MIGDWIEWAGGECPVSDKAHVHIKCRDGWDTMNVSDNYARRHGYQAKCLRWQHDVAPLNMGDIVAYRVVQP